MFEPREIGEKKLWSPTFSTFLFESVSHPIYYAKVLIQIGYEPIAPKKSRTLFGRPALALPNIFQYVRYIKSVDGFTGCYRGLLPKLCSFTVGSYAVRKTADSFILTDYFPEVWNNEVDIDDLPEKERNAAYIRDLIKDIICRVVGIIASHPLDVIAIRTMAQFVGGETKYNGLLSSIGEVYRENGIAGYYSGLVPKLIGNISTLVLVSGSTYIINKHFIRDPEMRKYTGATMAFLSTTVTYPFLVVYHCMAVNNCGLAAGLPPQMPIYSSWTDSWKHLASINGLKRGGSAIWCYYTAPQIL